MALGVNRDGVEHWLPGDDLCLEKAAVDQGAEVVAADLVVGGLGDN